MPDQPSGILEFLKQNAIVISAVLNLFLILTHFRGLRDWTAATWRNARTGWNKALDSFAHRPRVAHWGLTLTGSALRFSLPQGSISISLSEGGEGISHLQAAVCWYNPSRHPLDLQIESVQFIFRDSGGMTIPSSRRLILEPESSKDNWPVEITLEGSQIRNARVAASRIHNRVSNCMASHLLLGSINFQLEEGTPLRTRTISTNCAFQIRENP